MDQNRSLEVVWGQARDGIKSVTERGGAKRGGASFPRLDSEREGNAKQSRLLISAGLFLRLPSVSSATGKIKLKILPPGVLNICHGNSGDSEAE